MAGETDTTQTTTTAGGEGAAGADTTQTPAAGEGASASTSLKDAVAKALSEPDEGAAPAVNAEGEGDDDDDDEDAEGDDDAGDEGQGDEAAAAEQEAAAGEADPDLVPPKGISENARERFNKLVDRVKEGDQRYTELDGKFRGIEQTLKGTGATPEQWGQVLTAMRYANSGDPQQARQALEILDGYRAEIARVAGVPIEGVDVLADFPDLRGKVEKGDLDEESAAELAASRRAVARNRQQNTEQQTRQQQTAQLAQRQQTAQSGLTALGAQLQKADVDYPRKVEILEKRGVIDRIVRTQPPEEWQGAFQEAYDTLSDVVSTVRTPAPKPNEQPMRGTGKSGSGAQAQPKTIAEAVRMAVNE